MTLWFMALRSQVALEDALKLYFGVTFQNARSVHTQDIASHLKHFTVTFCIIPLAE